TVAFLQAQGVGLKVISGDDPATVATVAAEVGMVATADEVVDARGLLGDEDGLAGAVRDAMIFGRTAPDQKRSMVRSLQATGRTVAMTGDGVNDVLALKAADVGIAMGRGATPAARAVAQVVVVDGDFSALPELIAEGRRVLGNVERVAKLFVTTTVYVPVIALATGVARLPFPFLPRHLTLVSGLTIGIPGLFLALSPSTSRYRPGFLSRVLAFTVPAGAVAAAASFDAYAFALIEQDVSVTEARTSATLVLLSIGLWVVVILARPFSGRRAGLVVGL
ncbi:MAG: HAD-IC family P-type ATPase, partial [Acidimicrobiales bacterium]